MCPPMRAHCRHLANTIVLPSAHLSPQPKRQIDRLSHFWSAHGRVSSDMSFLIIAPPHGGSGPHIMHTSFGPPESITQMASQLFSHFCTDHSRVAILYNGPPLPPLKLPLPMGDLDPDITNDFLGPSEPTTQMASRLVEHRFCTGDCRVSLYFTVGCPFPTQNCHFPWGNLDLHLIQRFPGPPKSSTQTASRSVQQFLQGSLL